MAVSDLPEVYLKANASVLAATAGAGSYFHVLQRAQAPSGPPAWPGAGWLGYRTPAGFHGEQGT